MSCMGRKPLGLSTRSIALPPELWARIERFREAERISNTTEALRILLWRTFDQMDKAAREAEGEGGGEPWLCP